MKLNTMEEFVEEFVKGEINESEFTDWNTLTYPRQLELKLGRAEYKLVDTRNDEELTDKVEQLSNVLKIGLVPVKAILLDNPGTTKYLCSDILQELQLFVDSTLEVLAPKTKK